MRRIILSATIWLLLLANLVYFVWAQGVFAPFGFGKSDQGEPQRLERQILPDRITLLNADGSVPTASSSASVALPVNAAASAASATSAVASDPQLQQGLSATQPSASAAISGLSAPAGPVTPAAPVLPVAPTASAPAPNLAAVNSPAQCLQTGAIDRKVLPDVRKAFESQWPAGSWKIISVTKPGRWIVYMGKYANAAQVDKKKQELKELKVVVYPLKNPELAPGLSLGVFDSKIKANVALQGLAKWGVRTAKVVEEEPGMVGYVAVIPHYTAQLQPLLDSLKPKLGGNLQPCDKDTPR